MSSTNMVRKIKYNESNPQVISLQEYVIFTKEESNDKYIVFKFNNSVNQKLVSFTFLVKEFDSNKNLLEEITLTTKDEMFDENATFIPKAKLLANKCCAYIEVELKKASFERSIWENGEFIDIRHPIEEFDSISKKIEDDQAAADQKDIEKIKKNEKLRKAKLEQQEKNNAKEEKKLAGKNINVEDITNTNKPTGSMITSIIMTALCVIAIVVFSMYAKINNLISDITIDDITYQVNTNDCYITKYTGNGVNVVVPDTIDGKPVTQVQSNAFSYSLIQNITFPASVISIGNNAFDSAFLLSKVEFKGINITINAEAFKNCIKLKEIVAGDNLSKIGIFGTDCFYGCESLESFKWNGTINVTGNFFYNCKNLKEIRLPNGTLNKYTLSGCVTLEKVYCSKINNTLYMYQLFGSSLSSVPASFSQIYISTGTYPTYTGLNLNIAAF